MAVYTHVSADDIADFITDYSVGDVISLKGIAEGVENSNYLLSTSEDKFILTLYEKRVNSADLPFFLGLMEHLAGKGINCAVPVVDNHGAVLKELCGRPAALISFLDGLSVSSPNTQNCGELGASMAQMHLAVSDFNLSRPNDLSVEGWMNLVKKCEERANECYSGLENIIHQEIDYLEKHWPRNLPTGIIHADLFPDNVFFLNGKLSGLIDYYFACSDILVYDIAICLNSWCFEANNSFNIEKAASLIKSYNEVRPLSADEISALPILCRGAALRFLLTRLYDWLNRVDGALVETKDPIEYIEKLKFHQKIKSSGALGMDVSL